MSQSETFSIAEGRKVMDVMRGESDRGCVLVGASLIEWQLGELLRREFTRRHEKPDASLLNQIDVMLNPMAEKSILGAVAARARMCRVLKLIDEGLHTALKQFFAFRNKYFAHAREDVSFQDEGIKTSIDELIELMPMPLSRLIEVLGREPNERDKVCHIIACFSVHIQEEMESPSE